MSLLDLDANARAELFDQVRADYDALIAKNLKLDLTRGKPSAQQLNLANELLTLPGEGNIHDADGVDVRNYGNLKGIKDIRAIWAELLKVELDEIFAGDGSSLNMMFDAISFAHTFGTQDSPKPWSQEETVKWICPVPGYDRHFTITETFGYEMISIPWLDNGPDMDAVTELLKDPQVKGMWIVPIFANPSGHTISREVAEQLAAVEAAAPDFRVVWDNAYALHPLSEEFPEVLDILEIARQAGNPNRFWQFASTSKITHAGSGVAFFTSSTDNLAWYSKYASVRGIGPNKINQLAHARFFGDAEGVRAHMRKHAEILAPKIKAVEKILEDNLGKYEVARWTKPTGGYFISLDVIDGTASRVVELARQAGISLTEVGSSYPLHQDPNDRNIRLAPSLPPIEEAEDAMKAVTTCVLYAALEKLGA